MNNTPEQILEQFKEWLVAEEDGALRAGIDLESRHQYSRAQVAYRRNEVLGDVREKLTELGVKFG